ncbi:MAG TPA: cation diffusion facilitator family transporter [Candidatus Limnocylindria bacterium]|jgi:cobalt-zinc-cadmium efflux system protein|nr:cation diffusion facilitator family transporter [Candidatus Limnocylindria bacterium]
MHPRDPAREFGAVRSGLAATGLLCVVELVGGWLTNSLALMSDAAHMFTDMAALGLTLFALWICSRPATETKTFGYYRAEILAALVNGVILWVIVVFIVAEAWRRLHHPPPVAGRGLLALALVGLAVNAVVALRLREHRGRSLNLRGAYLHILADLLGSFGAAAAGLVIVLTGWNAADALASGLIAALILFGSWALVREAVDVLMEAAPAHVDLEALRRALERVPGTDEVHDLHVWSLTTGRYALSAHAVVGVDHEADDAILAAMAAICARDFHIEHVTIQIEHESRRAAEPAH